MKYKPDFSEGTSAENMDTMWYAVKNEFEKTNNSITVLKRDNSRTRKDNKDIKEQLDIISDTQTTFSKIQAVTQNHSAAHP